MSQHTNSGAHYTTQDLIRMAQMEYFGQYSAVVMRAMIKLAAVEEENKNLRKIIADAQPAQVPLPEPQGRVFRPLD